MKETRNGIIIWISDDNDHESNSTAGKEEVLEAPEVKSDESEVL